MMTPINRIPQLDSPLAEAVAMEITNAPGTIAGALLASLKHDDTESNLSVMLDWAMQIRDQFGIEWAQAIHAASILYYG